MIPAEYIVSAIGYYYNWDSTTGEFYVSNYPIKTFNLAATGNPLEGGIVESAGEHRENKEVTVTATANHGYRFVNWTENGLVVSTQSSYAFVMEADRHLVANFEEIQETGINIPDANLEKAIRDALNKPIGIISETDMLGLMYLNAQAKNISNLYGLEYATNLQNLHLNNNQISDISPLAGLINLTMLDLFGNQVSDISPLVGLNNLQTLELRYNNLDIIPGSPTMNNIQSLIGKGVNVIFIPQRALVSVESKVSVVIDNHFNARPQAGLSDAELVYETSVAPGITRFLAIFDLRRQVDKIGPVRSARKHFVDLASGHRGAFAHAGGSNDALSLIPFAQVMNFDEIYGSGRYFYRADGVAPYNLYTNTSLIQQGVQDRDGLLATSIGIPRGNMSGGVSEDNITVQFPGQNFMVDFIWNEQNQNYERYEDGKPILLEDESKITANNVVVIFASHEKLYLHNLQEWVINPDVIGKGPASFYRDGKVWYGEWKKPDTQSQMSFNVEDEPFQFSQGNTWFLIVPKDYYELDLMPGWNTLSVPLKLEKNKIEDIIDIGNIDIVYAYNAQEKRWLELNGGNCINSMDALYVKVKDGISSSAKLYPYSGLSIAYTKPMWKGWNLIGPALNIGSAGGYKMQASRVLASLNNNYSQVISQQIGNQFGWLFVVGDSYNPYMYAGKGYWVYVFEDAELAGFSSTPVELIHQAKEWEANPPSGGGGGGAGVPGTPILIPEVAIPELPTAFFGLVNDEYGGAIPEGIIEVVIDGQARASKSFTNGKYGLSLGEHLVLEKMYFDNAENIQFRVNGLEATCEEVIDWSESSGKLLELNLTVNTEEHNVPIYQSLTVTENNTVELMFNKDIINNLATESDLKAAIMFASDGVNYRPLYGDETVEIVGNKLIIAFQKLTGDRNQIKLAASTLRDRDGNILEKEIVTNLFEAKTIDECFIATAAYGSKLAPAVTLLRQFRDTRLLTNKPGQAFVNFYYTNSPSIAKAIGENEILKLLVRVLLLPIIVLAWALMNLEVTVTVLILGTGYMIVKRKQRKSNI
jgi:hypothetical protein